MKLIIDLINKGGVAAMNYSHLRHRRVRRVPSPAPGCCPTRRPRPGCGQCWRTFRTAPLPAAGSRRTRAGAVPSSTPSGTSWPSTLMEQVGEELRPQHDLGRRQGSGHRLQLNRGEEKRMRSEQIKTGVERTPNRSLLYAWAYTMRSLPGPSLAWSAPLTRSSPGHMGLDKIAEAVKAGIRAAGGTPVMFSRPSPCATASPWAHVV